MNFCDVLNIYINKHPEMKPRDAALLAFQIAFGESRAVNESADRKINISESDDEIITPIGEGRVLINIESTGAAEISPEIVEKMSLNLESINASDGKNKFIEYLNIIRKFAEDGKFSFTIRQFDDYFRKNNMAENFIEKPSEICKKTASQNYVITDEIYVPLLDVIKKIDAELKCKSPVVAALDGRSGSGKTHFATSLGRLFEAPVIHMDDFFLPHEMRTRQRTSKAGFNVHYERIYDEVIQKLRLGEDFSYGVYDCHKGKITKDRGIHKSKVIIIEGTYSMHPILGEYYDASAFLTVKSQIQIERIIKRNGLEAAQNFIDKWIPLEEEYFKAYDIEQRAEFVINTENHND